MSQTKSESSAEVTTFNPASKLDGLSPRQTKEIESQSRPSAALIHETIRAEGESELERRWWAILVSGLAAGISMGLSLIVQGEFHSIIADDTARRLFAPLGYCVGFLVVVLGRQQLFTENTLTPILPLLHHRNYRTFASVLRLWTLVLLANVVGTWAIAFVLSHSSVFEPRVVRGFIEISGRTISSDFSTTVLRAIFAGWIIALMMWLLPAAKGSRAHIIFVMTYLVALGEFSHVIAGSVDCAFLVQVGHASLSEYLFVFFFPTLVGNIIGGTTLVALLNYGQVAAEVEAAE